MLIARHEIGYTAKLPVVSFLLMMGLSLGRFSKEVPEIQRTRGHARSLERSLVSSVVKWNLASEKPLKQTIRIILLITVSDKISSFSSL